MFENGFEAHLEIIQQGRIHMEICDFALNVCCAVISEGKILLTGRVEFTILSCECPIIQTAEQRPESRFVELYYNF